MSLIKVSLPLAAPPHTVWEHLSDLGSHSQWMKDALSVDFETDQRRGVGVRMKVPTKVGPLRVTDVMEVSEWTEGETIGVRRLGRIGGWGQFRVAPHPDGAVLILVERLCFPWYLGGGLTGWLARPILRRVFRSNLSRFGRWVVGLHQGSA